MLKSAKVGDEVSVELPGGFYTGVVREVLPNYASTGETHYSVKGGTPVPFETICHRLYEPLRG